MRFMAWLLAFHVQLEWLAHIYPFCSLFSHLDRAWAGIVSCGLLSGLLATESYSEGIPDFVAQVFISFNKRR